MIKLFCNYYIVKNLNRQHEINMCLYFNLINNSIDKIYLLTDVDLSTIPYNKYHHKIIVVKKDSPTFYEMLEIINNNTKPDDINIFCNSDIIIDENSILLCNKYLNENTCFCLSRYDLINNIDVHKKSFLDMASPFLKCYSQDTWIVRGNIKNIDNKFDYLFGTPGCDNRFVYDINQCGYTVLNPSYDILTFHYHLCREPYVRKPVYISGKLAEAPICRLIDVNLKILIKSNNLCRLKNILISLNNTNYNGIGCNVKIYTNKRKIKKYVKHLKSQTIKLTHHINKNILCCNDKIVFKTVNWYNYYIDNNYKTKIKQRHA